MSTTSTILHLDLPAVADSVARARQAVRDHVAGLAVEHDDVALVISEAVSNVVLHAYRDREVPGRFRVRVEATAESLELDVCDDGVGMSPRPDSPGLGMGIPLMASLASHMEVGRENGTQVRLRFALGAERRPG